MKAVYYMTLLVLAVCATLNVVKLFNPKFNTTAVKAINIIAPISVAVYLCVVIIKRKQLKEKIGEQIHKTFSKN